MSCSKNNISKTDQTLVNLKAPQKIYKRRLLICILKCLKYFDWRELGKNTDEEEKASETPLPSLCILQQVSMSSLIGRPHKKSDSYCAFMLIPLGKGVIGRLHLFFSALKCYLCTSTQCWYFFEIFLLSIRLAAGEINEFDRCKMDLATDPNLHFLPRAPCSVLAELQLNPSKDNTNRTMDHQSIDAIVKQDSKMLGSLMKHQLETQTCLI